MSDQSGTMVKVSRLHKNYRKRAGSLWQKIFRPQWESVNAVDGISFNIEPGEAVAFLGPNGAGKTTTTKMLTGLIYPSAGQVKVLDFTPFNRQREFLCRIGLVMGNKAGLNWDLTARQSFTLFRQMYEIPDADFDRRVSHYCKLLNVSHKLDVQVRRLSLGERMKLELIGAILHAPEVLFLDEPTIGLDIESKQALRTFLKTLHKEQGVTLLLTSHDMDDVESVCERVIVINHGHIIYDNSLHELTRRYHNQKFLRLQLASPSSLKKIAEIGKILESNEEHTNFLIKIGQKNLSHTLASLPQKVDLADLTIETTPLEQIIGDLYKKARQ